MWKKAAFMFAVLLAVGLAIIFLLLKTDKRIELNYSALGIRLAGTQDIFHTPFFTCIYADPQSIAFAANIHRFALCWKHTTIPFDKITTTTLGRLGFPLDGATWGGFVSDGIHHRAMYTDFEHCRNGSCGIRYDFKHTLIVDFSGGCENGRSKLCPLGFSFDKKPEFRFPLTQKQAEAIFGPPDSIDLSPGDKPWLWRHAILRFFFPRTIFD